MVNTMDNEVKLSKWRRKGKKELMLLLNFVLG